ITALLAQGYEASQAATIGVCIHGLAADLALTEQSPETMLPSDVTKYLGIAFKSLLQRETSE
ncbi:MAG: NAD(P)H-hydrate dehydratase, partial [Flavobacteriales bacterium]